MQYGQSIKTKFMNAIDMIETFLFIAAINLAVSLFLAPPRFDADFYYFSGYTKFSFKYFFVLLILYWLVS